jgi:parallel beta-helix repeat protein
VNIADNNSNCDFDLDTSSGNTLIMNTATGNSLGGFVLLDSSDNNTLSGNTASSNGDGFDLEGGANNTLSGNRANNNNGNGFDLGVSLGVGANNTLSGNTANNNILYGYYDTTSGTGTAGTANFYTGDECSGNRVGGSFPSGLGTPQS